MKKTVLIIMTTTLMVIGATSIITSCGAETNTEDTEVNQTAYYCPMKCEGEKTYTDENTPCPTCGMDLVEVE